MSQWGGQGTEPGRGAREQAERAAAQVREAQQKLDAAKRRQSSWAAGAEGERRTAAELGLLTGEGWQALHDVHWPGRPYANIDHIAVGPAGVVVIDSKNWSGRVGVRDSVLRQNGYRRTEACEGAAAAAAAVAALLDPQHRSLVSAVICLVDRPTPPQQPLQVSVIGLMDLIPSLRARKARLSPGEIQDIAGYLRRTLAGPRSPVQATTAALAAAGPAPRAQLRTPSGTRRGTPPVRCPSPAPQVLSSQVRNNHGVRPRGQRKHLATVVKLVAILYLLLVLLPAWANGLRDAQVRSPAQPTPAVSSTGSSAPR